MEEPDVPWDMDKFWIQETKDRNLVSWMLHEGLLIGKKMLVAGMIISSAPVVVPPLVVMSALGFALSVPYGIILVSYTCSEKLLDKLLPGTSPTFSLEEHEEVEEDYGLGGGFDMVEEQEKEVPFVWTEVSRVNEEEPGGEVIMGYQETYMYSPTGELPVAEIIEGVVLTADALERDRQNSEIVEASIAVTDVILMDSSGKGDNLGGVVVEETKVLVPRLGVEGNPADSVSSNDSKLEHGVTDKTEVPAEATGVGKKIKRKGRKKKFDEKNLPKASDDKTEIKTGVVQPVAAIADAKEDHQSQAKDEVTAPKAEVTSTREEDALWQRIDAVRRIVGYKAVRQATCIEELKALYLFTGVEPSVLFKDASDLEEVREKLRFLLSVVGVE